ncbi:ATP-binding protein [Tepidibacillus marianensis]|uniref:ATP-binding protein n=1 Tax=Tepidibacillus marianensis TaxID=3131995 RepID=UPI0030CEA9DB
MSCKVNKTSLITVETNHYSVPCSYVGQAVWAKIFVNRVIVVAQNHVIAEHTRSYERSQMITVLDHYLEALLKKPRAIRDAHAFQSTEVPEVFKRFHLKIREQEGSVGDRKFIRLLLLHRDIGMETLTNALLEAEKTQVFRYERASVMITTNLEFTEWTSIFGNEKMTAALLDRLTHRAHILLLNGESYRFRQTMKQRDESNQ